MVEGDIELERRISGIERKVDVLQERVQAVKNTQDATAQLPTVVAKWEGTIESLVEDLHFLRERVEERDKERKREREQAAQERKEAEKLRKQEKKSDRRWLVGTILASAGLVVGAIEFFVSNAT